MCCFLGEPKSGVADAIPQSMLTANLSSPTQHHSLSSQVQATPIEIPGTIETNQVQSAPLPPIGSLNQPNFEPQMQPQGPEQNSTFQNQLLVQPETSFQNHSPTGVQLHGTSMPLEFDPSPNHPSLQPPAKPFQKAVQTPPQPGPPTHSSPIQPLPPFQSPLPSLNEPFQTPFQDSSPQDLFSAPFSNNPVSPMSKSQQSSNFSSPQTTVSMQQSPTVQINSPHASYIASSPALQPHPGSPLDIQQTSPSVPSPQVYPNFQPTKAMMSPAIVQKSPSAFDQEGPHKVLETLLDGSPVQGSSESTQDMPLIETNRQVAIRESLDSHEDELLEDLATYSEELKESKQIDESVVSLAKDLISKIEEQEFDDDEEPEEPEVKVPEKKKESSTGDDDEDLDFQLHLSEDEEEINNLNLEENLFEPSNHDSSVDTLQYTSDEHHSENEIPDNTKIEHKCSVCGTEFVTPTSLKIHRIKCVKVQHEFQSNQQKKNDPNIPANLPIANEEFEKPLPDPKSSTERLFHHEVQLQTENEKPITTKDSRMENDVVSQEHEYSSSQSYSKQKEDPSRLGNSDEELSVNKEDKQSTHGEIDNKSHEYQTDSIQDEVDPFQTTIVNEFTCQLCQDMFRSEKTLKMHRHLCSKKKNEIRATILPPKNVQTDHFVPDLTKAIEKHSLQRNEKQSLEDDKSKCLANEPVRTSIKISSLKNFRLGRKKEQNVLPKITTKLNEEKNDKTENEKVNGHLFEEVEKEKNIDHLPRQPEPASNLKTIFHSNSILAQHFSSDRTEKNIGKVISGEDKSLNSPSLKIKISLPPSTKKGKKKIHKNPKVPVVPGHRGPKVPVQPPILGAFFTKNVEFKSKIESKGEEIHRKRKLNSPAEELFQSKPKLPKLVIKKGSLKKRKEPKIMPCKVHLKSLNLDSIPTEAKEELYKIQKLKIKPVVETEKEHGNLKLSLNLKNKVPKIISKDKLEQPPVQKLKIPKDFIAETAKVLKISSLQTVKPLNIKLRRPSNGSSDDKHEINTKCDESKNSLTHKEPSLKSLNIRITKSSTNQMAVVKKAIETNEKSAVCNDSSQAVTEEFDTTANLNSSTKVQKITIRPLPNERNDMKNDKKNGEVKTIKALNIKLPPRQQEDCDAVKPKLNIIKPKISIKIPIENSKKEEKERPPLKLSLKTLKTPQNGIPSLRIKLPPKPQQKRSLLDVLNGLTKNLPRSNDEQIFKVPDIPPLTTQDLKPDVDLDEEVFVDHLNLDEALKIVSAQSEANKVVPKLVEDIVNSIFIKPQEQPKILKPITLKVHNVEQPQFKVIRVIQQNPKKLKRSGSGLDLNDYKRKKRRKLKQKKLDKLIIRNVSSSLTKESDPHSICLNILEKTIESLPLKKKPSRLVKKVVKINPRNRRERVLKKQLEIDMVDGDKIFTEDVLFNRRKAKLEASKAIVKKPQAKKKTSPQKSKIEIEDSPKHLDSGIVEDIFEKIMGPDESSVSSIEDVKQLSKSVTEVADTKEQEAVNQETSDGSKDQEAVNKEKSKEVSSEVSSEVSRKIRQLVKEEVEQAKSKEISPKPRQRHPSKKETWITNNVNSSTPTLTRPGPIFFAKKSSAPPPSETVPIILKQADEPTDSPAANIVQSTMKAIQMKATPAVLEVGGSGSKEVLDMIDDLFDNFFESCIEPSDDQEVEEEEFDAPKAIRRILDGVISDVVDVKKPVKRQLKRSKSSGAFSRNAYVKKRRRLQKSSSTESSEVIDNIQQITDAVQKGL